MLKYTFGDDGYYMGAVLKPSTSGVIHHIVFKPGGDWITYRENGQLWQFPLWNHFPDKKKRSLGDLTDEEFEKLKSKLGFLPSDELTQCYEVLKEGAKRDENARQTRNRA